MVDSIISPMADGSQSAEEKAAHEAKMSKVAEDGSTKLTAKDSRTPEGDVTLTQVTPDPTAVATRPDDVPEKFWNAEKGEVNVEALLKSQKDGEATIHAKPKTEVDPTPEVQGVQDKTIADASTEFAAKGELTVETYASLEKSGLSRDMVDTYIEGQQAIVAKLQSSAFGEFDGSQENYDAAVTWARDNLSDDEIKALDVQITSTSPGIVKQGAAALAAKFAAGADISPDTTLKGGGNAANKGVSFKSSAEMQTAMRDPKYKTDPAFRAEVSAKIASADKQGINLFI